MLSYYNIQYFKAIPEVQSLLNTYESNIAVGLAASQTTFLRLNSGQVILLQLTSTLMVHGITGGVSRLKNQVRKCGQDIVIMITELHSIPIIIITGLAMKVIIGK